MRKQEIQEYKDLAVKITERLIRYGAFNPPGNEKASAEFVADLLRRAGFSVELHEFLPNRVNLKAVYGDKERIGLILNGHLDVVPAAGKWERDPLSGETDGENIYGRGACDMLSGCAAITAAGIYAARHFEFRKGLMILLVADEENINRGIRYELDHGRLEAEAAVVAEPTNLNVALGNKGYSSFFIKTKGQACHSSKPWDGENAIYKMGHILCRLEAYAESLQSIRHPMLGQATACVGTIQGGIRLNTVPDACEAEFERRLLPGETIDEVEEQLKKITGTEGEVVRRSFIYSSMLEEDHELAANCMKALNEAGWEQGKLTIFTGCSEAAMFSVESGIPTVLLGPGDIRFAHRENEYCPIAQIRACVEIFACLIGRYSC